MFFKRKSGSAGEETKIFFCTDVHGSTVCFKKFINAADFYGVNILILGGDTTGKMVVPIVKQNGHFVGSFAGKDVQLQAGGELEDFTKRVANMGFYPAVMDESQMEAFRGDSAKQHELFVKLIRERWEEWIEYAEKKLANSDVQVLAAPGNDDFFEVDEVIGSSRRIVLPEGRVHQLTERHEIVTTGWTNRTPWDTERECDEPELGRRLDEMIAGVKDLERCIFNIHVPPHNAKIDICAKLDADLKVIYDMGNPVQAPAGSTAVRTAIERYQPLLGLHGHIHEGKGQITIGRTLCLNPGSVYSEGVLNGAVVTLSDAKVKDVHFTQG